MTKERINILLIEDNPGDARLIHEMLTEDVNFGTTYEVCHTASLQMATRKYSEEHFQVILLDMNLPDSAGLDTIQHLSALAPQTPIIILTGVQDEHIAFESAQYGAQDYIVKNECTGPLLKRTIHYAMERKRVGEQLKHMATHDPLTGLPNRALFYDRLSQALRHAERNRTAKIVKWKVAVVLMDLDHFKNINDSLGHLQGDAVIQGMAKRLLVSLRASDTVARLGGDEFIIILEGILNQVDCLSVAQKLLLAMNEPIQVEGLQAHLSASMGISIFPDDAEDVEGLIRCADAAMYRAKRQRGQICFHQENSQE
jgi:diguanylate cyclase